MSSIYEMREKIRYIYDGAPTHCEVCETYDPSDLQPCEICDRWLCESCEFDGPMSHICIIKDQTLTYAGN
jgi:hypothetical protein